MSILLHGDCLEKLQSVDDNSVDFIFCDLPYGQTSCAWDTIIAWDPFWKEILRVKKLHTPIFFTTTTKFGVALINNAPKSCPFRYDLVWVKSAPAGFLSAKKMPMRKHEMVYCFYEKLPFYDLSSHKHKFIKEVPTKRAGKDHIDNKGVVKNRSKSGMEIINTYDPPLPVSVLKEVESENNYHNQKVHHYTDENGKRLKEDCQGSKYDPPLPTSVVKEVERDSTYGSIKTHDLNIKGNTGVPRYDPPLPVSVLKEDEEDDLDKPETINTLYCHGIEVPDYVNLRNKETGMSAYDPPLPTTMLEIKSTRGKHSTEKPVALMEWLLKYYSKEGDVVLDPTMGSGSTGVACKNMNRNFIGIEKDPDIYEVAVNRIEG